MSYSFQDIKRAYRKVGMSKGMVVLVKSDLRYLGPYEIPQRSEVLQAHLNALADIVDLGLGTIVVSTASVSLCNTEIPYNPERTTSEQGVLSEYIRIQKNSVRSYHPYMSYTALGADAEYICNDVSRHSFGLETPKDRILNRDGMYLSVGLEPRWTCTYVHHIEMLMGVPYRYTKEFVHPIVKENGKIVKELFYMFLCYKNLELERNRNVNIFKHYISSGYTLNEADLGAGKVYGYRCTDFCESTANFLKNNIYGWLSHPPGDKPFRK